MKNNYLLLLLPLIFFCCSKKKTTTPTPDTNSSNGPVYSTTLLHSEDFENGVGQITPSHTQVNYKITTNSPKSGSKCLRLNLRATTTDPITGLAGNGLYTANWLPDITLCDSMTWIYNVRFDDVDWAINGDTKGNQVDMKLLYLMTDDADNLAKTFFVAGNFGDETSIQIAGNGDASIATWEDRAYGWRREGTSTPRAALYLNTGYPSGADGLWHEFKVQIIYNHENQGYSKIRLFMDGHPVKESNSLDENIDENGWFNLPPEVRIAGARLAYTSGSLTANAVDRTGYACGIQWDDLKVYSGLKN